MAASRGGDGRDAGAPTGEAAGDGDGPGTPAGSVGRSAARRPPRDFPGGAGLAGASAAGATLGIAALLAAIYEDTAPVDNVATGIIDHAPRWLVDVGISLFGTNDKLALGVGTVVVVVLLGVVLGRRSWQHRWLVVPVYAAFALVGWWAAAVRPDTVVDPRSAAVVLVLAAGAGAGLHLLLLHALEVPGAGAEDAADGRRAPVASTPWPLLERRGFLALAAGVAIVGVAAALEARAIVRRVAVAARDAVGLPAPARPASPPPADAAFDVPGLSPLVTPNADFYRIDTAFSVPRVDPGPWSLSFTGLVDEPFTISYDELLAMPMVERYLTICCVSNEVGGGLIGNARWLGVPLATLLERARPTGAAQQVVGRSVDGFTAGFPLELASDGRVALVAVGMNGEPLPFDHGFPARLVVEGVYGYVSATKWLSEVELTTWDGFDGYWIPRGWAKEAPILTESRIDVPRRGTVPPGSTVVAGVAWAQGRGISKVEVRVDDGAWRAADLAAAIGDATWRQWKTVVDLAPGSHVVAVRATDGTGATQTGARQPPAPSGATGYHTVRLDASA